MRQDNPRFNPLFGRGSMLLFFVATLFLFSYFGIANQTFESLGLSADGAVLLMAASMIGSMINIPITHKRIVLAGPAYESVPSALQWLVPYIHYHSPRVTEQVVAVNVGGCVVPVVFSAHLLTLPNTSVPATLCATAVMTLVVRAFARRVPGVGVTMPTFVPPLAAALAARGFANAFGVAVIGAAPVAYIAGTLGTLIGADLLNLPAIMSGDLARARGVGTPGMEIDSIGGAGVFDGIFLTSILAPVLATL